MTPGDPGKYLHGERGHRIVLVPQSAARWLYQRGKLRDRGEIDDPEIEAAIVALALAALDGADRGHEPAPTPDIAIESTQQLNTRTAAHRLGLTPRAIVHAINGRRLNATKDSEGRWRITQHDLDAYRR